MDRNYRNSDNQEIDIDKLKRWMALGISLILGGLSIKFSVGGFGGSVNKNEEWMGWLLAVIIVGIELIWNSMKDKTNLTLWVAGMLCYIYGIYTNITGFLYWQGFTLEQSWINPTLWIFPLVVGIFLEIVPEPLLLWALTGNHQGGDFLGNLFGNKMIPNPDHVRNKPKNSGGLFDFGDRNKKSDREFGSRQLPKNNNDNKPKYQPKNSPRNPKHGTRESDLIPLIPIQQNRKPILPNREINNWQDDVKREHEKWTKKDLYNKNLGEMEEPNWND